MLAVSTDAIATTRPLDAVRVPHLPNVPTAAFRAGDAALCLLSFGSEFAQRLARLIFFQWIAPYRRSAAAFICESVKRGLITFRVSACESFKRTPSTDAATAAISTQSSRWFSR